MLLVTWKTGKSLLAPDPFSLVSFLTVILPEPDHSVLDGKNSLLPEMQGLRQHIEGGQWLFWAKAVSGTSVCWDSRGLLAPSFPT